MDKVTVGNLGALSLIVGPVLALVAFAFQPGGLFIDSADISDGAAQIAAAAGNDVLANWTTGLIVVGLVLMLHGLQSFQDGNDDNLAQLAFTMIAVGIIGWIFAQALTLMMADGHNVYAVKSGLVLMSAVPLSLGVAIHSYALSNRDDPTKFIAWIVAAASLVALVTYVIGILDNAQLDDMIAIARVCYIAWVVWFVMLGVESLQSSSE